MAAIVTEPTAGRAAALLRPATACPRSAILEVERTANGHSVTRLRRGSRVAPRILATGAVARVCLVSMQAGPMGGDDDRLRIVVGAGATLVLTPVAATLALAGRGRARIGLEIVVGAGGRLVLDEGALILARGAHVQRTTQIALGAGAIALLRDVVVLGRAGELGGRLDSSLRAVDRDGVVLHDALRLDGDTAADVAHVALAAGHRVAGTLCLLGAAPPAAAAGWPALARAGALLRASARGMAELETQIGPAWAQCAQWVEHSPSTPAA